MDTVLEKKREILLNKVQENRLKVESYARQLKRYNTKLIVLSLIASAFATVLSGWTAAMGPVAGQGPAAWKWTCGITAAFTASAGIFTGLHQRFNLSERLGKCVECVGKLNALDLALTVTLRDPNEIAKEYEAVTAAYQDFLL